MGRELLRNIQTLYSIHFQDIPVSTRVQKMIIYLLFPSKDDISLGR